MDDVGYRQYCGLARALDVVGDRWTLLIVRELIPGPRRFTDLVEGLPGISRNLLTQRLKDLERHGILVKHHLPPPAARQVYVLTDEGAELAAALSPLIRWGARRLGDLATADAFHPRWAAIGMSVLADARETTGIRETYQFLVDGHAFHLEVNDGTITLHDGPAPSAAVTWTTDERTWAQLAAGFLTADDAAAVGQLTISGNAKAAARLRRIFSRTRMMERLRTSRELHG